MSDPSKHREPAQDFIFQGNAKWCPKCDMEGLYRKTTVCPRCGNTRLLEYHDSEGL